MKTMKTARTIMLTALTALAMIFTSCDKDDDTHPIVGTWFLTSSTNETVVNGVSEGVTNETVDENNYTNFTFNANGTFTETYSEYYRNADNIMVTEEYTDNGTYLIDGNTITLTYIYSDDDPEIQIYEFTLANNQLIIVFTEENTEENTIYITTSTLTK